VHTKETIDLVDHYKARFDLNNAQFITKDPTTCFFFDFSDNRNSTVQGYLRVPLVKSTRDIKFFDIPDNSYAFFTISNSDVKDNGMNNFSSWDELLSKSAFYSTQVTNPFGYLFGVNDMGGFNYIVRNIYVNNPGLSIPQIPTTNFSGCNIKDESVVYRNCPAIHGPLRNGEIFNGPRDYVSSGVTLVLLDIQDQLRIVAVRRHHADLLHLGHQYLGQ